ncbi:unnamed protein product [Lymnaea stagnalis]|uniref:Ig-like domain-containing protein n=1 Tax=Lymnaea stagnalis TaxID=6523 RepID=A0AAV2ICG3_LYMST
MGKSLCMISFGLFTLVFMFAFQNSDAQSCGSTYRVGQPANFTYSNSSAVHVEWRLQSTPSVNKTIACTLDNNTCSSSTELTASATAGQSVLTINQMRTNYKSVYAVVDGVESIICRELKIYAQPENITCSIERQSGSTNDPVITFSATNFFPVANIAYFTSNGTTIYRGSYAVSLSPASTSNGTYYNVRETRRVTSPFLRRGTNSFFITFESGYADTPGVNCSLPSIDIYPAVASFTANGYSPPSMSASFNSSVTLTCNVGPVPAETITLSRRGMGTRLNTTGPGTSITYLIPAFGCSDLDEYLCTVDNGQWSKASTFSVSTTCPPVTAHDFQNNVTLTTENGGSIFITFKVISYPSPLPNDVTLWILEDGRRYASRADLRTTNIELTSQYFYDVNVALLEVHDSDFRDYALVIANANSGDGISYFFTASQKTSVDVRGVAIGVGVVAVVLLIVVVVIIALLVCRRRRRRAASQKHVGETEMVKPQNYDSTESSDASWGIDSKSREAAAPKNKMPPRPVKTATRSTEQTYEPMTENSKPHRPHLPPPPEDVYEIEPNGDSQRPQSYYGNMPDQPIYGNA